MKAAMPEQDHCQEEHHGDGTGVQHGSQSLLPSSP